MTDLDPTTKPENRPADPLFRTHGDPITFAPLADLLHMPLLRSGVIAVLLSLAALPGSAGVIVLEGQYQGKNLFVQNPFSEAGVGFCVFEVTVNEQIATAGGITVNMIHVVLQQRLPLGGYVTTGNIVVGSATSGVN